MSGNSRSDGVVQVSFSPMAPGDCLNDKTITELARRMNLSLIEGDTAGDAVVSRVPPDDPSKIWYPADENGFPIGVAYKYDPLKQTWVSTAPVIDDNPTICPGDDNFLFENTDGCWYVPKDLIEALIDTRLPFVSADENNGIRIGSDGGWFVSDAATGTEGQIQIIGELEIATGTAAVTTTVFDLSGIVTVPSWATHAIVRGYVGLDVIDLVTPSTDKAYSRLTVGGQIVANVGNNPGPNTVANTGGGDSNDLYTVLDGTEISYSFALNESPGWNAATDSGSFRLELIGFVRAGIATP